MTAQPLISREPCASCDDIGRETETGAGYCRAHGDFDECPVYRQVRQLENIAAEVAKLLEHVCDASMRREIAEATADGFNNALWEAHHAEMDTTVFLRMCAVARALAA